MEPVLLLTRPAEGAERVRRAVELRLGHSVAHVTSPLLKITDLPFSVPDGAIPLLTSEQGARRAGDVGLTGPAFCVGERTAAMARARGMKPLTGPGDANGLFRLIVDRAPKAPLIHIHGRHVTGDLSDWLRQAGFTASEAVAYNQQAQPLNAAAREALAGEAPLVVPLFSTRTATLFAGAIPEASRAPLRLVAISAAAAAPLEPLGRPVSIAAAPDLPAMVGSICAAWVPQGCS